MLYVFRCATVFTELPRARVLGSLHSYTLIHSHTYPLPGRRQTGCSPSFLERLSGKYLNGSDRAFLGRAERRKLCHFAPSCGLLGPRNGARSEFPDSLSRKLADQARFPTPRYRIRIRAHECGCPRRTHAGRPIAENISVTVLSVFTMVYTKVVNAGLGRVRVGRRQRKPHSETPRRSL